MPISESAAAAPKDIVATSIGARSRTSGRAAKRCDQHAAARAFENRQEPTFPPPTVA